MDGQSTTGGGRWQCYNELTVDMCQPYSQNNNPKACLTMNKNEQRANGGTRLTFEV
jgi:hypothetical protein